MTKYRARFLLSGDCPRRLDVASLHIRLANTAGFRAMGITAFERAALHVQIG